MNIHIWLRNPSRWNYRRKVEKGIYATGRRKTSVARVWIYPESNADRIVNGKSFIDHFCREVLIMDIDQPLELLNIKDSVGIKATVKGGGLTGQAGAVRLALARALCEHNPDFRPILKSAGFLTRDDRKVERKKYGLHKARKRPQYSKR